MNYDFYDKPFLEDIQHYGVKGMKWGVIRTPRQLGHKINKLENKRRKAVKRYQQVEFMKRGLSFRDYNRKSYKASKNVSKKQKKIVDFMKENEDLFNKSISNLSKKQVDIGKKWLTFSKATEEQQFWMSLGYLNSKQ